MGLVGVVAALIGAKVIATDLPDKKILSNLLSQKKENNLNFPLFNYEIFDLTWGNFTHNFLEMIKENSPHFILSSDCFYNPSG